MVVRFHTSTTVNVMTRFRSVFVLLSALFVGTSWSADGLTIVWKKRYLDVIGAQIPGGVVIGRNVLIRSGRLEGDFPGTEIASGETV